MILILSNAHNEPTTDYVIDWLLHYKASFLRVNSEDVTDKQSRLSINIDTNHMIIGNQEINTDEINVVWYRRWYDYRNIGIKPSNRRERKLLIELFNEAESILFYIYYAMQNKLWLTDPVVNRLHNKLYALHLAHQLGLRIPQSFITNNTAEVMDFLKTQEAIITKPMADPTVYFDPDGSNYKSYTEKLTPALLKKLPSHIFMSLFQQMVQAECELRTFYLDGEFYSTAIVNSSSIDIKLSVKRDMNVKMIAYEIPEDVKQKLRILMKKLNLNTGSIDIIKSRDGEYYFLEVNPIGQFSGYGYSCNYQLEKRVAEWLIKNDQSQKHLLYEKENKIHEHIRTGSAGQDTGVLQVHEQVYG